MEWIDFTKQQPPCGKDVLVLKTYLDAPYDERGYHPDESFWVKPWVQIDTYWADRQWHQGGKATHWMHIPESPQWNGSM